MQTPPPASARRIDLAAATVLYRPDPAVLDALLEPLVAAGLRIVIFANGPLDDAIEARLARVPDLNLTRSPTNVGLGVGLNAVMEAAQSEGFGHVVLFDQDSTPDAALLPRLLDAFLAAQAQPGLRPAVIAPLLVAPAGEAFLAPWYSRRGEPREEGMSAVDFLPTSGTLVSIAAWREIGPFRGDYFIDGIDVEWCFRAWSKGYSCLLAEKLQMVHRWGYVAEEGKRQPQILRQSDLRTFYYLRNAVEGLRLPHMPTRWKLRVAVRLTIQSGLLLLHRRFAAPTWRLLARAMSDGWTGRMGPAPQPLPSAQ